MSQPEDGASVVSKPYRERPQFKELEKTEDYVLRDYMASRWVMAKTDDSDYRTARGVMFRKLKNYIDGNNERNETMAMTVPGVARVTPGGAGPTSAASDCNFSFYIPPTVSDPPTPTDNNLSFNSLPAQRVYVRVFGGKAVEKDWLEQGEKLAQALQRDGRKFEAGHFYTAVYDSPFKVENRHNEVWYVAKD